MRIGLVGVGRIGCVHARTLRELPGVDAVTVADSEEERATRVAKELDLDAAPGVADLVASRPDGLVVAAPTPAHASLVHAAAEAGVPVFCEKPLAPDVAGTRAVIDHVATVGVPLQTGFQRRFDAGYGAARDATASGELGWVHTVRACTHDPAPPPAGYIPTSGGLYRDCSVHDFDAIRWVTGREVVEAYATGANLGAAFFAEAGDVDTAAAVLTLDDQTLALVGATRYNGAGYDVRLEVHGSKDTLAVGLDRDTPLRSAEPDGPVPGAAYPGFLERFGPAYRAEMAAFVEVVAGRAVPVCGGADALEALYVAEACERSRAQRRPVRVEEVRL